MKRYLSRVTTSIIASLFVALPAWAQGNLNTAGANLGKAAKEAGTSDGEISSIVGTFINALLTLVGLFFLILMVYAGYLWMTARGESDQVDKAKKIIIQSIVGLAITVGAYSITAFIVPAILERTAQ